MTSFWPPSLRWRSTLLVLFVMLPVFGLVLYIGIDSRSQEIAVAKNSAVLMARQAGLEEEQLISATHQLLAILAEMPQMRTDDAAVCDAFMTDTRQQFQSYANLGVIALNGDVVCSAVPLKDPVNVADRGYFTRALQTRDFAVGEYQVGRVTGAPSVNFGYPVLDETGQIKSVVFAALDLAWLNRLENQVIMQLPEAPTLIIVDGDGIVLVHQPDQTDWVGRRLPDALLAGNILTRASGVFTSSSVDSIRRVYAFATLDSATASNDCT